MCKAQEQLKQMAFAEGKKQGEIQGEKRGEKRGEKKGLAQGILGTVTALKEVQLTAEQIQEKLMKIYSLTADEALKYITD